MSAGIAVKNGRIRTTPAGDGTPSQGLTRTNRHYRSEGFMKPTLTPRNLERFWVKVNKTETCWLWIAGKISGYGSFAVEGRAHRAHRISYELLVGNIPEGLVLDHICRIHACVNPEHLRVVDHRTNILAGISPTAIHARKTHCVHGHEFTPENTHITIEGARRCKACDRLMGRKRILLHGDEINARRREIYAMNHPRGDDRG